MIHRVIYPHFYSMFYIDICVVIAVEVVIIIFYIIFMILLLFFTFPEFFLFLNAETINALCQSNGDN